MLNNALYGVNNISISINMQSKIIVLLLMLKLHFNPYTRSHHLGVSSRV